MNKTSLLKAMTVILMMGASMGANAGWFGLGGTSWKEEVLLHDGTKIVVERHIERGGRHEIGQKPPVKEETLTFDVPKSGERVAWKTASAEDIGYADLKPLALDIVNGVPYLVTDPVGCLAYNKWKRPNPPYIVLRYESSVWRQIGFQELPGEIKKPNLIISSPDVKAEGRHETISAADIAKLNSSLPQPQYRSILREAIKVAHLDCGEMTYDGRGGWVGIGWFRDQPSYEACLKYCVRNRIETQYCPCNRFFEEGK